MTNHFKNNTPCAWIYNMQTMWASSLWQTIERTLNTKLSQDITVTGNSLFSISTPLSNYVFLKKTAHDNSTFTYIALVSLCSLTLYICFCFSLFCLLRAKWLAVKVESWLIPFTCPGKSLVCEDLIGCNEQAVPLSVPRSLVMNCSKE